MELFQMITKNYWVIFSFFINFFFFIFYLFFIYFCFILFFFLFYFYFIFYFGLLFFHFEFTFFFKNLFSDPQMKEMDLSTCEHSLPDFQHISKTCLKLEKIYLDQVSDINLKELFHMKTLTEVKLVCTKLLSNKMLKTFAENCPNLKILELKNSERIQDKSIEYLLKHCPGNLINFLQLILLLLFFYFFIFLFFYFIIVIYFYFFILFLFLI